MMKPSEKEYRLIGQWHFEDGVTKKDNVTQRIEWLINNYLKKIGVDASGWDALYIDPADERLWELTYPQNDMNGGGPPSLITISAQDARKKYSLK